MIKYNTVTNEIEMHCGDTGTLPIYFEWNAMPDDTVLLFAVFDANDDGKADLIKKPIELIDGAGKIRLCNSDTRDLEPGTYHWQLRIVTGAESDEQGNIVANDCSDDVHSWFLSAPKFKLLRAGGYV